MCKPCRNKAQRERDIVKREQIKKEKEKIPKPTHKTCKECKESKLVDDFSKGRAIGKICRSIKESKKQKEQRDIQKEIKKNSPKPPEPTHKKCKGPCGETKTLDEFPKGRNKCKICRNAEGKQSYDKNHKKKPVCDIPGKKICRGPCRKTKDEKDFIKDRNLCKECKSLHSNRNYLKDKEYHLNNLQVMKTCLECDKVKPIECFAISKNYCRKCKYEQHTERVRTDPKFRIRCYLSSRLYYALKNQGTKKSNLTMDLTNCSKTFLKEWMEHQFDSKMSWENYGPYWHVDHVIPCASFNLLDEKEQFKCFNWKNLRPCEGKENISKGNKIDNWQILLQEIRVNYYKNL